MDGKAKPEDGLKVGSGIRVDAPVPEAIPAVEPLEDTLRDPNPGGTPDDLLELGTFGGVLVGMVEGEFKGV